MDEEPHCTVHSWLNTRTVLLEQFTNYRIGGSPKCALLAQFASLFDNLFMESFATRQFCRKWELSRSIRNDTLVFEASLAKWNCACLRNRRSRVRPPQEAVLLLFFSFTEFIFLKKQRRNSCKIIKYIGSRRCT